MYKIGDKNFMYWREGRKIFRAEVKIIKGGWYKKPGTTKVIGVYPTQTFAERVLISTRKALKWAIE